MLFMEASNMILVQWTTYVDLFEPLYLDLDFNHICILTWMRVKPTCHNVSRDKWRWLVLPDADPRNSPEAYLVDVCDIQAAHSVLEGSFAAQKIWHALCIYYSSYTRYGFGYFIHVIHGFHYHYKHPAFMSLVKAGSGFRGLVVLCK